MILLNTFMALFAIFISPQIFVYYRYPSLHNSLALGYGLILSFTGVWITTLLSFYLKVPSGAIYIFTCFIVISSFIYMFIKKAPQARPNTSYVLLILSIILLLPLLTHIGIGFSVWDVLASWNKWAIELYDNNYYPIDAAYPILMPALWSLIYKIQGTTEIWWTAQISLFVLPLMLYVLLFNLYTETKNKAYIFIAILIYPYLLSIHTINGNMDMPVMIMGTLSLIMLYTAEYYHGKKEFEYYVYAALLFAGIASIIKQPGLVFILFILLYISLHYKSFTHKKRLLGVILLTLMYFFTYLSMYYMNNIASPTGNLKHLENLSEERFLQYDVRQYLQWLQDRYFQLPKTLTLFVPILAFFKIKLITPFLILLGFTLFLFKGLRKFNSVGFLSAIFFIFGTVVWVKFFSYDERNALWVKSFFILFLSINLSYAVKYYVHKTLYTKIFITLASLGFSWYLYSLGDTLAHTKQKASQMQAGIRYGCLPSITYAVELLKDKEACVKLYTNELPMTQNYRLKTYKDKLILIGRDYKFYNFSYLNHNCKSGSYIIFRKASAAKKEEWWKVQKMVKDGILKALPNKHVYAYFVPPNITFDSNYFKHSQIIKMSLQPIQGEMHYHIDAITDKDGIFTLSAWAFIKSKPVDNSTKYLLLKNDSHTFIISTHSVVRKDVTESFKAKDLSNSGFKAYIYKEELPKGRYEISIVLEDEKKQHLITNTGKVFNIN